MKKTVKKKVTKVNKLSKKLKKNQIKKSENNLSGASVAKKAITPKSVKIKSIPVEKTKKNNITSIPVNLPSRDKSKGSFSSEKALMTKDRLKEIHRKFNENKSSNETTNGSKPTTGPTKQIRSILGDPTKKITRIHVKRPQIDLSDDYEK